MLVVIQLIIEMHT